MSSKIPTMSAGRAGSSKYNVNVNGNQGGGSKKGGLAPTTNKRVSYVLRAIQKRAYSSPDQRKMIYCVNQLGGIGAPTKMFATGADGSCASCSKEATANNFVILAYRQLLGRGVDNSGLRKYTKQILNDQRGLGAGMSQVVFDLTNSPEGRKYINQLSSVEAQKRISFIYEYIKKASGSVSVSSSAGGSAGGSGIVISSANQQGLQDIEDLLVNSGLANNGVITMTQLYSLGIITQNSTADKIINEVPGLVSLDTGTINVRNVADGLGKALILFIDHPVTTDFPTGGLTQQLAVINSSLPLEYSEQGGVRQFSSQVNGLIAANFNGLGSDAFISFVETGSDNKNDGKLDVNELMGWGIAELKSQLQAQLPYAPTPTISTQMRLSTYGANPKYFFEQFVLNSDGNYTSMQSSNPNAFEVGRTDIMWIDLSHPALSVITGPTGTSDYPGRPDFYFNLNVGNEGIIDIADTNQALSYIGIPGTSGAGVYIDVGKIYETSEFLTNTTYNQAMDDGRFGEYHWYLRAIRPYWARQNNALPEDGGFRTTIDLYRPTTVPTGLEPIWIRLKNDSTEE